MLKSAKIALQTVVFIGNIYILSPRAWLTDRSVPIASIRKPQPGLWVSKNLFNEGEVEHAIRKENQTAVIGANPYPRYRRRFPGGSGCNPDRPHQRADQAPEGTRRDNHSRRGLPEMVGQRRSYSSTYLQKKDINRYRA